MSTYKLAKLKQQDIDRLSQPLRAEYDEFKQDTQNFKFTLDEAIKQGFAKSDFLREDDELLHAVMQKELSSGSTTKPGKKPKAEKNEQAQTQIEAAIEVLLLLKEDNPDPQIDDALEVLYLLQEK